MTTQAEMHRLLRPIAERYDDLFVWKRSLVIKPVHHFLRYVLFDNTSVTDGFMSRWGITECFSPDPEPHISYTVGLNGPAPELRYLNQPASIEVTIHGIEHKALPRLRAMSRFDDHMAFIEGSLFHLRPTGGYMDSKTALIEVGGGHLDLALPRLRAIAAAAKFWRGSYMEPVAGPITDELLPLVEANDRKAIGRVLASWEERWIKALKLEKFWEPTPFPVELG